MAKTMLDLSQPCYPRFDLRMSTKTGKPIRLEFYENVHGQPDEKGFVSHLVIAWVEGMEAGYLRIGYVPRDAFRTTYPSIVEFLARQEGWIGLRNKEDPREILYTLCTYENRLIPVDGLHRENIMALSDKSAATALRRATRQLGKYYGHRLDWFEKNYVDQPLIEFIHTHGIEWRHGSAKADPLVTSPGQLTTQNWRAQGIAPALYFAAGLWMQENGMRLQASPSQQPPSKRLWALFDEMGLVAHETVPTRNGGHQSIRLLDLPADFDPQHFVPSAEILSKVA